VPSKPSKFAFLSRFGMKFVEVGGAGIASALCAYCLGQLGQPSAPPPAPPIVQVLPASPASEDALRMARDDHALLAALVRKETESQSKAEGAAETPAPTAVTKPAKSAQAEPARRSPKPPQAAQVETQPRAAEPLPIQPPIAAAVSAPKPATPASEALPARDGFAAANTGEEDRPLLVRLRQIPSWFLPDNDRVFGEVPRPPMPIGELLSLPLKATAVIR
jgi:hypothetical protein